MSHPDNLALTSGKSSESLIEAVRTLRGNLNHRPLGYEPSRIDDSNAFQGLDAAGNDTESLKRHESTVIGPQSDDSLILLAAS
jgi:hypothetical protein